MSKKLTLLALAALVTFGAAGCTVDKQPDGTNEVHVSDQAREAGEKVVEGTKEAVSRTGEVMGQAGMTGKISGALRSAGALNVENLDVDTVDKTITLKGYVPTENQKQTALKLAEIMAGPDYKIVNEIAVK